MTDDFFEGLAFWGAIVGQLDRAGQVYDAIEPLDVRRHRGARAVAGWLKGHAIAEAEGALNQPPDLLPGEVWRLTTAGLHIMQFGADVEPSTLGLGEPDAQVDGYAFWVARAPSCLGVVITVKPPEGAMVRVRLTDLTAMVRRALAH